MDGRAHLRTESGWGKFDLMALTLAALGAIGLMLLNAMGYGPMSYKSCFKPEQIQVEAPKVTPPPIAVVPEPKLEAPKPDVKVEVPAPPVVEVSKTEPGLAWPVVKDGPVPPQVAAAPMLHPVVEGPAPKITVESALPAALATAAALAAIEPSLNAAKVGKQVSLTGVVPSAESKSSLVSATQRALGNGGAVVIDRLIVDEDVKPAAWLNSGPEIIKLLGQMRGPSAVDVAGNEVRLTGTVSESTDKEVAGLKAVEIFGSDSKLYNLVTLERLADPVVEIETSGKHAIVTGKVNSEATFTALMKNVTSVFGDGNVTDRLAVDENVAPITWQESSLNVAKALSNLKHPGSVRIDNAKAVLIGMADAESEKSSRGIAMHNHLGPAIAIDNQIKVRDLSAPVVDLQKTDGKLTLSGQISDDATKSALLTAAKTSFGAANVTDQLTVGAATGPIDWSANAGQVTEQVLSLKQPGGIRVIGNSAVLTGLVSSESERDARLTAAKSLFGPSVTVDNQIRVELPEPTVPAPAPQPEPVPLKPPEPEPKVAEVPPPVPVVDCKQIAAGTVVEFAMNKADLTDQGRAALDQVILCLKDTRYEVAGHTDSTGNQLWNRQLSLMRAEAAVDLSCLQGGR